MIDRGRVRLVWWAPGGAPVVVPLFVAGYLACVTCDAAAFSWIAHAVVLCGWAAVVCGHYWERRLILRHFWALLRPDAEAIWTKDGWAPERALAAYVSWYNRRFYRVPVVELAPPPHP